MSLIELLISATILGLFFYSAFFLSLIQNKAIEQMTQNNLAIFLMKSLINKITHGKTEYQASKEEFLKKLHNEFPDSERVSIVISEKERYFAENPVLETEENNIESPEVTTIIVEIIQKTESNSKRVLCGEIPLE
ncbi:MAG: hypothetical protein HQM10_06620 [Candidatus Riflebacteria bacterium]|nr:hypothetical protein [Candidatus Riflebacteria bacterium]